MATKYLLDQGHSKVGFISAPLSRPSRQSVFRGYQDALKEYEIVPDNLWIQIASREEETSEKNYEFNNGIELTRNLLKSSDLPTAIFACNDMTAFGVMNELAMQGVKIPEQMSVIGFDNIEFSSIVTPPLTTIQQPDYEMGRMACNMLLDKLDGETAENVNIMLQPRVIERSSTKKLL